MVQESMYIIKQIIDTFFDKKKKFRFNYKMKNHNIETDIKL